MKYMMFFKKKEMEVPSNQLPQHIGFIMDGNGRWAKQRHLPRSAGHRAGANTLKSITRICGELGIPYITFYAFSTDNWSRPKEEVDDLMKLLYDYLCNADETIGGERVRIRVSGDMTRLDQKFQDMIADLVERTKARDGITATIALNYGGKDEIVHAVRKVAQRVKQGILEPEKITEEIIAQNLYTPDIPDPDLIIRTSGEMRISNFLLWESAYAELYFSKVYWPDFDKKELMRALEDYSHRQRRFGGV